MLLTTISLFKNNLELEQTLLELITNFCNFKHLQWNKVQQTCYSSYTALVGMLGVKIECTESGNLSCYSFFIIHLSYHYALQVYNTPLEVVTV